MTTLNKSTRKFLALELAGPDSSRFKVIMVVKVFDI
jgi:hypothetical protein